MGQFRSAELPPKEIHTPHGVRAQDPGFVEARSLRACTKPLQPGAQSPKYREQKTLSFLSLFFGKNARKTSKKQGFFIPTEPLKSLEKKGKTLKKTRKSSQGKKQGIPKKQVKEGLGSARTFLAQTFLNTPRGPGHPGQIPGTSQVPPFQTQGRQTWRKFKGQHD